MRAASPEEHVLISKHLRQAEWLVMPDSPSGPAGAADDSDEISFAADILPLFRPIDTQCMRGKEFTSPAARKGGRNGHSI